MHYGVQKPDVSTEFFRKSMSQNMNFGSGPRDMAFLQFGILVISFCTFWICEPFCSFDPFKDLSKMKQ